MQINLAKSTWLVCALAAFATVGCNSDDSVDGKTGSKKPLTVEQLCAAMESLQANQANLCIDGHVKTADDLDDAALALACRPGMPSRKWAEALLASANAGRVSLDWSKGNECLEGTRKLRRTKKGVQLYTDKTWKSLKEGACKDFYRGKVAQGGACEDDWDCPADMGCYTLDPTAVGAKTCQPGAAIGAACDAEYFVCAKGGRCDNATRKCVTELLPEGETCANHNDCESGVCVPGDFGNSCSAMPGTKALGEACTDVTECAGECVGCRAKSATDTATTCQMLGAEGEYCSDWNDCVYDLGCTSNKCTTVGAGQKCYGPSQGVCEADMVCAPVTDCAALTSASACGAKSDCQWDAENDECVTVQGECVALPTSGPCAAGGYCGEGTYCAGDNNCTPFAQKDQTCSADGATAPPCGPLLRCEGGICKPGCEVNEDCGTNEFCSFGAGDSYGQCVPMTTSCEDSSSCDSSKWCETPDAVCAQHGNATACATDSRCVFGTEGYCDGGFDCSTLASSTACGANADCQWGNSGNCDYTVDCEAVTVQGTCTSTPGCAWVDGACDTTCASFDTSATCTGSGVCAWNDLYGACYPKCWDYEGEAECNADTASRCGFTVTGQACTNKYDCTQHDDNQSACDAQGAKCEWTSTGECEPGPDFDLGTCQPKLAVGTSISPDGCGLYNMSSDNAFGGGSAEQCVTGACFLDEAGDAKCALPAQYGCAGSDHVKTLASLLGLFGIVLATRRKKRS